MLVRLVRRFVHYALEARQINRDIDATGRLYERGLLSKVEAGRLFDISLAQLKALGQEPW